MKNQSNEEDNLAAILATAKFAYRTFAAVLQDAITRLEAEPSDISGAQGRQAVVKSHAKSLQQIIDLEVDLAKRSKTVCTNSMGHELDLDRAREEIHSRLAKLIKQRGG